MPSPVRAVFFDVVGTVLFPATSAPAMYAEVARRGGLEVSVNEIRQRFVQAFNAQEEIDRSAGWVTSEEREIDRWRQIVHNTLAGVSDPESCFQELFHHFAQPHAWRLAEGAGTAIAAHSERGIRVGLGSNYDRRLWSVMAGFPELVSLGERTVISSVVGVRKPDRTFFDHVVHLAECEAGEVLFVGDDLENDYHGALAAGLQARFINASNREEIPGRLERLTDLIG
jgi:putative hydrolase of the HAD superfamily